MRIGVEARPCGRATDANAFHILRSLLKAISIVGHGLSIGSEFLPQSHWDGVLKMRTASFDDGIEFMSLALKC